MTGTVFSSLRARLILLVLLAVVPALGVICYTAQEQRRVASVEAQQNALRLARLVSANQDGLIEGARQLLTALAQVPVVRAGHPIPCSRFLADLLKAYPLYANFGVVDAKGEIICSGLPLKAPVNAADRAWFQRTVQTGDFAIGDYQIGRITGKATVNFGYPISDEPGQTQGVAFAALDLTWFNKLAAKTQLPSGAVLTLIDRNRTILVRSPDPGKWIGQGMPEGSLLEAVRFQKSDGTAEATGIDGTRRLYGFAAFGDGTVIVGIPNDVAYAPAKRILMHSLGWLLLICTLAVGGAWLGGNWLILRQVNSLIGATRRLGAGDLSVRTGLADDKGELDDLARAFDQMAEALETRDAEAKRAEDQNQRHLKRIDALCEIGSATNSTLDLHTVLSVLMEKINALLPYTALLVWLRNRETGEVERAGCWNLAESEWKGRKLKSTPTLVQTAIDSKRPVAVSNIQTDPRVLDPDFYRRGGLISYLGVPLVVKGEVLGVLVFLTREPHEFATDEVEFLSTVAGQAAIAIHNSQLYEETKRQAVALERANENLKRKEEIQELLKELNQDVARLDVDSLLKKLTEKVREVFKVDACDVRILEGDEWSVIGVSGIDPNLVPSTRSGSLVRRSRWIIDNRKPLAVPDTTRSESHPSGNIMRRLGLRGYLGVPLISRSGEVVGVLRALTHQPRNFFHEEIDLLQQMANGAAIALENARLLAQTKSQASHNAKLLEQVSRKTEQLEEVNHQLSALCSVATVVSQSLDMNLTLHNGMHQVLEIFDLDAARIYIFDQVKKELHLAAHEGIRDDVVLRESYQPGEGFIGRVFETGEAIFFKDIQSDPEFQGHARKKIMLKAGFRAQFFIPIRVKGKTLGVISFAGRSVREFSPSEKELLYSIADQIGIAVENATLFSELRAKTNELEKASKVKNEFLGFVSHELKTPVNAIKGYTAMIQDKILGELNHEQDKALTKVLKNSDDLISMINTLLEATKIEAGAVAVESQEINLYHLLDELRSSYCVPLNKELDLNWDYSSHLPVMKSDGEKLRHILQNLINNAIKYTDRGRVTISARHVADMGQVQFKVMDTGIGIPKEALPLIFEMFRQVNGSESRSSGGVGLGLHIVKKFTELLGGKIEVDSQLGTGSIFTLTFPCDEMGR